MNKGVQAATGDVVAILNADDVYASTDVLARVAATFRDSGAEAVYGDLHYVAADDLSQVTRRWNAGTYAKGAFRRGWMPPHPALFVRRACYHRWGLFTLALRSAADYELMLRFIHRHGMTLAYLPETLVLMRAGGNSNATSSTASGPPRRLESVAHERLPSLAVHHAGQAAAEASPIPVQRLTPYARGALSSGFILSAT